MAFYYVLVSSSTNSHLQSSLFFLVVITTLLILASTTSSTTFNLTNFQPNVSTIHFENDSLAAGGVIELTGNSRHKTDVNGSVGRATYSRPIQLWDSTSGRLTDFATHFSFIIKGLNETSYGDGLTFFLSPWGSILPPNSYGGSLGLLSANVSGKNLTTNQIVAVEFDSYQNAWDPSSDHVGINVNSVVSVATVSLKNGSIRDGRKTNAWVSYNSTTKNLSIFLTYEEKPVFSDNSTLYHIVDLRKVLPEIVTVGFSAATSWGIENHKILSWEFHSTRETGFTTSGFPSKPVQGESLSIGLVVGLVFGLGGGCGFALFFWWKKKSGNTKKKKKDDFQTEDFDVSMDDEFEKRKGPKRFSYNELVLATNNFDEGGKLGQGGFGGVYKGFLSDLSLNVAVKRVSSDSKQGKKEYQSEVMIISQLRHRNLVQLIGWCHKRDNSAKENDKKYDLLLVYEFMPNRSLDKHLFRGENVLNWEVRYKIALGLASAMLYLHEEWEQCVLHRDIKSSNIMLDSNFNAKLGDFGLARIVDHGKGSQTTAVAGTRGYLAPECFNKGKFSKESDIYSFGIVALEIASGRKPIETDNLDLVEWVWGLYGSCRIVEAADKRLKMQFNESEVEQLMVVGLWCAHPDYKSRPSVTQVINVLKFESPLPMLPLELPTLVYLPTTTPSVPNVPSLPGLTDTLTGR